MQYQRIIDTASPHATKVARTSDGKVDFQAYIGLEARFSMGDLTIDTEIKEARTRFGHLDLLIQPVRGSGHRWVERKNLTIPEDPGANDPSMDAPSAPATDTDGFGVVENYLDAPCVIAELDDDDDDDDLEWDSSPTDTAADVWEKFPMPTTQEEV